ncbi:MAG: PD40 domain-containing protein [Chitinophagaceae bacterium]|nr:PD40 domain-containing protein [Chitinophagaceae bacterium]
MNVKLVTATLIIMINVQSICIGQSPQFGMFEGHGDVGQPALPGSSSYNKLTQEYTLQGAGVNMWGSTDQFHFLWKKIKGDFIISATIRFVGNGRHDHRKIGIMAREKLTPDSRYADACVHGDELSSLQFRTSDGAQTEQVAVSSYHPTDIELQRTGNTFTFSAAVFGENYKSVTKDLSLPDEIFAGLFICSHDETIVENAVFSNVRVIIPAPATFVPYRDYIGSHLEIMDVFSGRRKILHTAPNSLQAPNWTNDGKHLIYNSEGLLYTYQLSDGKISQLNTGFAKQNNNDHVLSFDGKRIAISNHVGEKRVSTLFVLPITGSDKPIQITSVDSGHSYLHGWSPDGRKLIFTGHRNNRYDIYTIDIATKKEIALTNTPSLDDGPEYTPDGRYIYFNSVRTGTMKIWRMKPDGSQQEQVTFDEYNDWFPHISPDNKWIVYLSFPKDINPSDHPFYKKVYIKLMPSAGGVPRTIGYVYGGQGSINVPSWSPDSRWVGFVSNSGQ